MDKESFVISKFSNKFIGDDGAVLGEWILSKDLFLENSHFKMGWLSFYEIGKKAMSVNLSDVIVMNAKPKFALIGLMLPKNITFKEIDELKNGILDISKQYGVKIIGGDTVKSDILGISVSIISYAKKPIFRKKLKNGELLAFTGNLGGSLKGLKILQRCAKNYKILGKNSRFRNVVLRDKFFYNSSKFINSAMDISDGLACDLPKFIKNKNIKFIKKLKKYEFLSGEEYEVLFSFNKKNKFRIINEAKKARIKLTIFGETIDGKYKKRARNWHF
ncbi:thiamine-phosphate kinase [Campylobacter ureolyticus]|uniref:thiamine-phosphate kinase n=1 Tax=Campylobacter ureolyticus TaxID=827 RepID=UPI0022B42560|nr:thiamine-phosphate kinase [Campylobacter ureolyticus]MCZ6103908.1 thiamine-phosphate kinase [Campylobacter ureolyticus]MCZ6135272.1 thiamine-phosphate kinase [Campylobacter ureolyticus]